MVPPFCCRGGYSERDPNKQTTIMTEIMDLVEINYFISMAAKINNFISNIQKMNYFMANGSKMKYLSK